jgi:predicted Zn-dependent peptidase
VVSVLLGLGFTFFSGAVDAWLVDALRATEYRGSLETVFGRSQALQDYNHYLGDPDRFTWDLDRFRKTTPEKIRAMVAKYLTPNNVLTVITNPTSTAGGAPAKTPGAK